MKIISVNVGQEGIVQRKLYKEKTGIFKIPTDKAVQINKEGLIGDVIISKKHHGGPDQAVYIYGDADYDWWRNELDRELAPGIFGENLTISGLESANFVIGDILHIGEVILQVTAPRFPCKTFSARMEDSQFIKKFRAAERPGLYCRVLKEGAVQAGTAVRIEEYEEKSVTIVDLYRDYYAPDLQESAIRRFLDAPIAIRMREGKEKQLKTVLGSK
ncbi:MAG: MOSC domain-containing protein [Chloroflexi bacterium]|nr:MOSC domain-containing protein [Chloroflexota bacterium]